MSGVAHPSTGITSFSPTQIQLAVPGAYQVMFHVSITELCQLVLTLNGTPQGYTVVGRATGTCQLVGMTIVVTSLPNTTLALQNAGLTSINVSPPPVTGGFNTTSAHITILRLS
jgi:hypothetical protein